eukprot:COSAG05_NODE_2005_length_3719_cov_10.733702_2_plen_655_part_00
MSFWKVDSKLAIAQKSVSVPSENGLSYTENQKIVIKIDPSVEYFQPSESYVQFRLKLKLGGTAKTRLQLNERIGGHSLLNHVRILSGTGVLLEEVQNYNVLCYLMYTYDTNNTKERKRSMLERTTMYNPACASTHGSTQLNNNSCVDNPYFKDGKDLEFVYVKVCLPLVGSGIFGNTKIFPTMLTQGLRLEITMEEAAKCVQRLCTVAPTFVDRDPTKAASGTARLPRLNTVGTAALTKGWKKDARFTVTAVTKANPAVMTVTANTDVGALTDGTKLTSAAVTPDSANDVGELVNAAANLYVKSTATPNQYELYTDAALTTALDTSAASGAAGSGGTVEVDGFVKQSVIYLDKAQNNITSVAKCPFVVGEKISVGTQNAGTNIIGDITDLGSVANIEMGAGTYATYVKITLGAAVAPALATSDLTTASVLFSTSFKDAAFKPGYDVDEVELVMQQIIMPKGYTATMMKNMKEKGMMRYDFVGYTNYKHSVVSTDTQATLQLPLQNSRAKSVLCLPLDSSSYTAQQRVEDDDASAFKGITDGIIEYRFNVDQKLNPDRPVPLGKLSSGSIEQQYLIELEKGLSQSGIQPSSFRNFENNFLVSRALALQGGSMDARGKNIDIQLSYGTSTKNKLWNIWCAHIRSIVVKQNDISVQV